MSVAEVLCWAVGVAILGALIVIWGCDGNGGGGGEA